MCALSRNSDGKNVKCLSKHADRVNLVPRCIFISDALIHLFYAYDDQRGHHTFTWQMHIEKSVEKLMHFSCDPNDHSRTPNTCIEFILRMFRSSLMLYPRGLDRVDGEISVIRYRVTQA